MRVYRSRNETTRPMKRPNFHRSRNWTSSRVNHLCREAGTVSGLSRPLFPRGSKQNRPLDLESLAQTVRIACGQDADAVDAASSTRATTAPSTRGTSDNGYHGLAVIGLHAASREPMGSPAQTRGFQWNRIPSEGACR